MLGAVPAGGTGASVLGSGSDSSSPAGGRTSLADAAAGAGDQLLFGPSGRVEPHAQPEQAQGQQRREQPGREAPPAPSRGEIGRPGVGAQLRDLRDGRCWWVRL